MQRIGLVFLIVLLLLGVGCSNNTETMDNNESNNTTEETNDTYILKGMIFFDENNDGVKDSSEKGITNVTVKCNSDSVKTDNNGYYTFKTEQKSIKIEVDESTLDSNYTLTTNNKTQNINMTSTEQDAEAIGYGKVVSAEFKFQDTIKSGSEFKNYYFELVITDSIQEIPSIKIWAMDNNIKIEDQLQTIYINSETGTAAAYNKAINQIVVAPITEAFDMVTPFTLVSEIDPQTFDMVHYKGTEDLDGKKVYVFENTAANFEARYYVWADTGIIIKMEATHGDMSGTYYFKDLTVGDVNDSDFVYPDGVEIIDMSLQN